MAVNVADAPAQMLFVLEAIATDGVTLGFTVMVNVFEVAVGTVGQLTLLVNSQITKSPLFKVELVYVVELVPTFTPFNFH